MENFIFQNTTKLIFGKNTVKTIGKELSKHGIKKVLMVYGGGSIFKNGVFDTISKSLIENNIKYTELSNIKANPVISKVYEGIELFRKENADAVLAVGGGSVIDTSKAIAAGLGYNGDVWDLYENKAAVKTEIPVFTVLTISATGSEMNGNSVITNEKKKWSVSSPQLFPKFSIVDPSVQFSLPLNQSVNGAVDTMSHVFELYFDRTEENEVMDEYSEGLIRTVMKNIQIVIKNPEDYNARANLALCATLALNNSNGMGRQGGDWATHNLEHSLSAFYDIAHGAGLAIMFPAWMKYVYRENIKKWVRFSEKIFGVNYGSEEEKAIKGIELLKEFYKKTGAPVSLREVGIPEEDLEKLSENALLRGPFGNMKKLDKDDVLKIYKIAY